MVLHYIIEKSSVTHGVAWFGCCILRIEQALWVSLRIIANFDSGDIGLVGNHWALPSQQFSEALSIDSFICYILLQCFLRDLLKHLLTYASLCVNG